MKNNRVIAAVLNEPWAATAEEISKVWAVVNRLGDPEALRAKIDKPLDNTRHTDIRNGVAIISVVGPMMRYANIMSEISGATSYEAIAKDVNQAIENPEVKSIILEFNSAGGTVTGCGELASLLQGNFKCNKPIIAYIEGNCCSAAYWIASACSKIYASETALIGSIGVQLIVSADEENKGKINFLSSHSPNKNSSVTSKEGKEERQRIVDDLGEVFVGAVAKHRGVSKEQVLKHYGQGSVFVAPDALNRGMIDQITTIEKLIGETMELSAQSIKEKYPEAHQEIFEEGAASVNFKSIEAEAAQLEKERILGILALKGKESLSMDLIKNGSSVGDAAIAFRKDEVANGRDMLAQMQAADEELNAPDNTPQTTATSEVDQAAKDVANMKKLGVF